MKIKLNDIMKERSFSITGTEPWLSQIYSYFPSPKERESPKIQADIILTRIDKERFKMVGSINYKPFLTCSRCGEPLCCAINNSTIDVIFQREENLASIPRSRELASDDLDNYFYEKDILDLESFLNEWINLGIPSHITHENVDPAQPCSLPANTSYESKQGYSDKKPNPFEVLKDIWKNENER